MAQGDTPITVVGNIVADPELRFTPAGAAVANFRIASTPRRFNSQTNQWEDGEAMFLTCNVWRQAAENVAQTLTKGMRAIVTGRLKSRSFQTREGENRTVFEIDVDEVGPSLRYATAQVARNPRQDNSGGNGGGYQQQQAGQGGQQSPTGGFGGGQPQGGFGGGQQSQAGQGHQPPENDPWNSAPAGDFNGAGDEPPF